MDLTHHGSHTQDPLLLDIFKNIEFRLFKEWDLFSIGDTLDIEEGNAYRALDVANTHIGEFASPIFNIEFLRTPRMSTVANGYIINRLVKYMATDQMYLNIGVWCGFSFLAGIVGNPEAHCVGVDIFTNKDSKVIFERQYGIFRSPHSEFFEMDYEKYFATIQHNSIGTYFYDGDHAYDHQYKGLTLADPYIVPGGYIIVDDTNDHPTWSNEPRRATLDFVAAQRGRYSIEVDLKTSTNAHPTFWNGLMILKKSTI